MSCKIYCIEDINGLKYVGSTIQKLYQRLSAHKSHKNCSSIKLDLDNCKIYQLEECDVSHRLEREKYWINHNDCVNKYKYNFDRKEYFKKWSSSSEKRKLYSKNWEENYKDTREKRRLYQITWGGNMSSNNNLLKISLDVFS